ncbi:MAG TPA: DNA polymerase I [Alphaproteobacteria bacterium]
MAEAKTARKAKTKPDTSEQAPAPRKPRADGKPDHVFLVDGSGYIFRAFHALPPMTRPDGTPVNAVYGFTQMLLKLVADSDAEYLAVIFDSARRNFRNEIFADYKANRDEPPDELKPQFGLIREATRAFSLPSVEKEGFEADDLIATYARKAAAEGKEVIIVSSDKDLMQLVGPHVRMLDPIKNRMIGPDEVAERFGVPPDKVVDVQALAGDSTDNVPGVPGIGVKTAAELINTYGDLDTLLARAGEIKQPKRRETLMTNADKARMSRELVRLRDDVEMTETLEDFALKEPDHARMLAFLREQNFKSIVARIESRLAEDGIVVHEPETATPDAGEAAKANAPSYELVQDEKALARWIEDAAKAGYVAVDTETTSLDAMRAELVGVSLSIVPGKACYIPVGHVARRAQGTLDFGGDGEAAGKPLPGQIARDRALAALKPMLEDPGILKIGHNIKYDMQVFARYRIAVAPIDDTMLLSYVLEGGAHGHGLDELAKLHLGHANITYDEVTGTGRDRINFAEVALERARDYAAEDADVTMALHNVLKRRLVEERMVTVYETMERPLVPVLAAMERAGVKVDRTVLEELSRDFASRMAELEKEIHRLAGREFAVGSPKQLGEVLFDEMGLAGTRKGKSGAMSTSADILEDLAAQGHDLPARVLDWRQLQKLKSTYTDALIAEINPETGRVHTSYSQAVASTGRLSSNDPNLQNIPVRTEEGRKIRRAFVAEKGWRFVSCDYSQIELRLLAHVADIKELKAAFTDGKDIHAITASEVFGVPVAGMDRDVRDRAKAINFGIIYGISPFGLARQLRIPQGEAKRLIDSYFEHYPGIRDYTERTKAFARKNGYVTTMFGRRCYTPGINDKNRAMASFSERAAINAPLQGAAADIIKRAMVRMGDAIAHAGLKARMLLQVHDELVFEAPSGEAEKTASVAKRVMEDAAHLSVPLVVDSAAADNWADAH